ncbi:hypothetical protein Lesp02_53500 [Lentzea sp. NBRC 105346]|uniref:hypothetical protein n=1 Tax=Lentzea sp. NBRC 105346 TaxID=3032205 RepID=UPI00249FE56E|nr:hypothetical protein [Lentzea sp. NBRC 105346]GLZ33162.1 hypothetical protein Lesp02_53500 [Lentzea sp. NBRC 105346]
MNKRDLVQLLLHQLLGEKKMKSWVGLAIAGAVLLLGFIAYRMILVEMIVNLRDR